MPTYKLLLLYRLKKPSENKTSLKNENIHVVTAVDGLTKIAGQ